MSELTRTMKRREYYLSANGMYPNVRVSPPSLRFMVLLAAGVESQNRSHDEQQIDSTTVQPSDT